MLMLLLLSFLLLESSLSTPAQGVSLSLSLSRYAHMIKHRNFDTLMVTVLVLFGLTVCVLDCFMLKFLEEWEVRTKNPHVNGSNKAVLFIYLLRKRERY